MSTEQLDQLKEALVNVKSVDFAWDEKEVLSETIDENSSNVDINSITSPPSYSSLFGNTISINNSTGSNGSYLYSNGSNPIWTTNNTSGFSYTTTPASMEVKGDLIVNGKNIGNILDKIQDRLAIIDEPSSEKLEKHAALKKAYDHYKLLEKLIGED